MKLGVVTTSYPRWPDDPAGNFVGGHVTALRALGHTVEVIAAGEQAPLSSDEREVTRVTSGGLFYTGGAPDLIERSPMRGAVAGAAFTARMTHVIRERASDWDAIVAHWLVPSAIAALPAHKPLLAIAHGGDIYTLRRMRLLAPVLHLLHARGAELAFVSDDLKQIALRAAPLLGRWLATARVQPMGIDAARFAAIPRAPTEPPTIAIAARLVPIKGIDIAIAALAHVRREVRLVIAGDGPERRQLQKAGGTAEFLGAIDTTARDALLSRASVVLVPSRVREGTPLIALEALAAGVPVIASAIGGLRSLPRATLVRPDDPRALAAAIDRVLDAPPGSADLRAAVAHLDWPRVAPRLLRSA